MFYRSTRGQDRQYTFQEVLLKGFAEDGGLILPERIPIISLEVLEKWRHFSYVDVVYEIAKIYIDSAEIPHRELRNIIESSYPKFNHPKLINFVKLKDGVTVAELFHGPTAAFKDLAMCVFAQLLNYFLRKCNRRAIVLVATSGDTGAAAISSMAGLDTIDLIVMYPRYGCTELQQLQMNTVSDTNIHCYSVDGTSDDEDVVMTKLLCDEKFAEQHNITVANSINWARILVQTATYFYVYLQSVQRIGQQLTVVVPTGAGGNLSGGCIAHLMGLPLTLVSTVNANDGMHQFLKSGVLTTAERVIKTWASAMDIQVPTNVERLIYLFSQDGKLVKASMEDFCNKGTLVVPENVLRKMKCVITDSYIANDSTIVETIKNCWVENDYVVCPHTATALAYCNANNKQIQKTVGNVVCMATASPDKFHEAIGEAGVPIDHGALNKMRKLPNRYKLLEKNDNWEEILRRDIVSIATSTK